MAALPWILSTERMVGRSHPTLADTLNRATRAVLSGSGYDPDATTFPGLDGPIYNVKAHGAVGDGVTDDTVAIQAALGSGNRRVYVPRGTYLCTQLLLSSNTELFGEDWQAIIKGKTLAGFDGGLIRNQAVDQTGYTGNTNIIIHDLTIDGSKEVGPTPGGAQYDAIAIAHCKGVRIQRCQIINPWYHAIDCCGNYDVVIADNRITGTHTGGLQIDSCELNSIGFADGTPGLNADGTVCSRIMIAHNYIEGAETGPGIHFHKRGSNSITITGNVIDNCLSCIQDDALATFTQGWQYVTITGNVMRFPLATGHGIALTNGNSEEITITGNTIVGADLHGVVIGITGANANNKNITVSGNVIDNANRSGVRIANTDGATIQGNSIGPCGGSGFASIDVITCTHVAVTGNRCFPSSTVNDGVAIPSSSSHVTVANNTIGTARDGVVVGVGSVAADVAITGNHITACNQNCIHVEGTSAGARITDVAITGNQIDAASTGQHAVRVRFAQRVAISGNQVKNINANNTGISLSDVLDATTVGNMVDGASAATTSGIGVTTSGSQVVSSNTVMNCATGINLAASGASNIVVQGHRVSSTTGIAVVAGCNDVQVRDNHLLGG